MAIKDVRVYFNKGSINNRSVPSKAGLESRDLPSSDIFFKTRA